MKAPPEVLQKAMEPMLRTLREAIAEAREAGATQEHIDAIVEVAQQLAHQRPYGVDLGWLLEQIKAAALPRQTVH